MNLRCKRCIFLFLSLIHVFAKTYKINHEIVQTRITRNSISSPNELFDSERVFIYYEWRNDE